MRHFRKFAAAVSLPLGLLLAPGVAAPADAALIVGSENSDNNSNIFYPQLNGTSGNDEIHGLRGNDLLFGRGGQDLLDAGPGADILYGEAGDDQLDGGVDSRDLLYGGAGNDLYTVGDNSDLVRELASEGTDTVVALIDYVLPANVENLFLRPRTIYGGAWSNPSVVFYDDCASYGGPFPCRQLGSFAMGNAQNNEIRGNLMDNRLYGLAGNDLLYGFEGDDELDGGSGNDVLVGFVTDGQWASEENDILTGAAGADRFVIGLSGRSGGMTLPANEHFPQYLGQGNVYIMDFDWAEGDVVEVYGDIADYWVELGSSIDLGPYAAIYWNGSSEGFAARELVGIAVGITDAGELVPALDFV